MLQSIMCNTRTKLMKCLNYCSHSSHFPWFSELFKTWSGLYMHICETNGPFLVYQYKTIFSLSLYANLKIGDDVSTVILNCPSSLMSFFRTVPPNSLLSIFCSKQEEWMGEWVNHNNFILSKKLLETLLKLQCSP